MTRFSGSGSLFWSLPRDGVAPRGILIALGMILSMIYLCLARLAAGFADHIPDRERPLLDALGLLTVAFGIYLLAVAVVSQHRGATPRLTRTVVGGALLFRFILLWSNPIQEADFYRYLWDGKSVAAGVDPYTWPPLAVWNAVGSPESRPDLQRLVQLRDSSAAATTILGRVHFAELTTIYPPVSQAVFAAAALSTDPQAELSTHVVMLKIWLLAFDLAALGLLIRLLRQTGRPESWSLIYGWCPLVLKECANSAHADCIAVALVLLALNLAVAGLRISPSASAGGSDAEKCQSSLTWWAAGAVLSLAAGAKVYPVVLFPLWFLAMQNRVGWRKAVLSATVCGLLTAALLAPVVRGTPPAEQTWAEARLRPASASLDRSASGLEAFASQWEINDFLFLILFENLRPHTDRDGAAPPWFDIVPDRWNVAVADCLTGPLRVEPRRVPFLLTRSVTLVAFVLLALWWARRWLSYGDGDSLLLYSFLTLAWFWLLAPTQNPWYWMWALPLVPLSRARSWLLVSGLSLTSYLRFWLSAHWPDRTVAGTPWTGAEFFDYVVVWLEYAPWFALLLCESWHRRRANLRVNRC